MAAPDRRAERRAPIEEFEVSDLACQIACFMCRAAPRPSGKFNPDDWMEPKEQRKVDDFIIYGMAAADPGARGRGLASRRRP